MLKRKFGDFNQWYKSPPTTKDRNVSSLLGIWAGFCIGIILFWVLSPMALMNAVYLVVGVVLMCVVLGGVFPKQTRVVFIPFVFFGREIS